MTAVDYVAQAAELLREHFADEGLNVCEAKRCKFETWDLPFAERLAAFAAHQAEVLAAAGLIPTRTEWGVLYEFDRDRTIHEPHVTEVAARRAVAASPTDHGLVSRPAHDWKDATDD